MDWVREICDILDHVSLYNLPFIQETLLKVLIGYENNLILDSEALLIQTGGIREGLFQILIVHA